MSDPSYVDLAEFKATASIGGTYADVDITEALVAASRALEDPDLAGRRFYLDADANQVRYYTHPGRDPVLPRREYGFGGWLPTRRHAVLPIDDLVELTELATDPTGDGSFSRVWTQGTDFVLEPRNAPADGKPYTQIRILPRGRHFFPDGGFYPDSIRVTGQFGWAAVPDNIKVATKLIAARLLRLMREGALGAIGFGADGTVVRVSRSIPDMDLLLQRYRRRRLFV